MMASSTIQVRRATLADFQEVLAIDTDVYHGKDYMLVYYPIILQNPAYMPYVGETPEGKIVSFMTLFVDAIEGFCCVMSLRTMEGYRGQGIVQKLIKQAYVDVEEKFKKTFIRLFVASDKPQLYAYTFWSDPKRFLIERHAFLIYNGPQPALVEAVKAYRCNPKRSAITVETLSLDRAQQVLCDEFTIQHVLRKSHLVAFRNFLPLPKCKKYLRQIALECNVLASFKTGSAIRATGISYSSLVRGSKSVMVDINFSVYEHVDVLLAHLAEHLNHTARVVPVDASASFLLHFPTEIDKEVVKDFLLPFFGVNSITESHPLEFLILWKEDAALCKDATDI